MAKRLNYTVAAPLGKLNVRENPSLTARILRQLSTGEKVKIDRSAETPEDWLALDDGGYVMSEYLE